VNGPAAGSTCGAKKDERLEEPNRLPESEKMMLGNVLETSSGMYPLSFHVYVTGYKKLIAECSSPSSPNTIKQSFE
jgi:hypothetical protein